MYIDGQLIESVRLPADYRVRRHDLFWKYNLLKGTHKVTFKWLNPDKDATVRFREALVYSDEPMKNVHASSVK